MSIRKEGQLPRWLIVPLVCRSLLPAQEAAPPPPTVFSVSTTIVQIDSVVTDAKGHQVTNLNAGDFQVSVDGKPQPITNFSYVRLDAPDVNRSSLTPEALRRPLTSTNPADVLKAADVRRSMVLVVDDLSLSFESIYYVRRTLLKFVDEQMQPGDLVALWETGRNNSVFQQFTSDKRVLRAAVENLRWNPIGLGTRRPVCVHRTGHASAHVPADHGNHRSTRPQRCGPAAGAEPMRIQPLSTG